MPSPAKKKKSVGRKSSSTTAARRGAASRTGSTGAKKASRRKSPSRAGTASIPSARKSAAGTSGKTSSKSKPAQGSRSRSTGAQERDEYTQGAAPRGTKKTEAPSTHAKIGRRVTNGAPRVENQSEEHNAPPQPSTLPQQSSGRKRGWKSGQDSELQHPVHGYETTRPQGAKDRPEAAFATPYARSSRFDSSHLRAANPTRGERANAVSGGRRPSPGKFKMD